MVGGPLDTRLVLRAGNAFVGLANTVVLVVLVGFVNAGGCSRLKRPWPTGEAVYQVGSIRAAEESYRAETLKYLNVTQGFAAYYPMTNPGSTEHAWDNPSHPDYARWHELNVKTERLVRFGYKVAAGEPGEVPPILDVPGLPAWPKTTEPWYIIEAAAFVKDSQVPCYVVGSSFTGEIFVGKNCE